MRNRLDLHETPIKHWDGANNLPGATSEKPGWGEGPMLKAKLIAWQYAVEKAGSEDALVGRTDWKALGIDSFEMLKAVRRCVPGFDDAYENSKPSRQGASDSEKAHDLYGRVFNMYRQQESAAQARARGHATRKREKRISCEHPQRSNRLRPWVGWAIETFHKKG